MTAPKPPRPPLTYADLLALGCNEQHAADWLQTRKDKGQKTLTASAWDRHCAQAAKVGITPAEAVTFCAERGHWGFYADAWSREFGRPGARAAAAPQSFAERDRASRSDRFAKLTGRARPTPTAGAAPLFEDNRSAAEIMEAETNVRRLTH